MILAPAALFVVASASPLFVVGPDGISLDGQQVLNLADLVHDEVFQITHMLNPPLSERVKGKLHAEPGDKVRIRVEKGATASSLSIVVGQLGDTFTVATICDVDRDRGCVDVELPKPGAFFSATLSVWMYPDHLSVDRFVPRTDKAPSAAELLAPVSGELVEVVADDTLPASEMVTVARHFASHKETKVALGFTVDVHLPPKDVEKAADTLPRPKNAQDHARIAVENDMPFAKLASRVRQAEAASYARASLTDASGSVDVDLAPADPSKLEAAPGERRVDVIARKGGYRIERTLAHRGHVPDAFLDDLQQPRNRVLVRGTTGVTAHDVVEVARALAAVPNTRVVISRDIDFE